MKHLSTFVSARPLAALGLLLATAGAAQAQASLFQPAVVYTTGTGSAPNAVAVADVNADGKPDLLTANSYNNQVGVLLGNGNGTFQLVATYSTGTNSQPFHLAVADVNGDGRPDVVTANRGTNEVGVLLGTGSGTFRAWATYPLGAYANPHAVAVADLNADGLPDLLTANSYNNQVGVLLGNGGGTFRSMVAYSTNSSTDPQSMAVADVNADGKLDVTTSNSTCTVAVLLGNGNGTLQAAASYPIGAICNPLGMAVADVNADGRPDLVTVNSFTDEIGVLLNALTPLPTRAALLGASATLAPNPTRTSTILTATGLPAATRTVEATLLDALGRPVRRLTMPAALGAATATVPTAGLAPGLYLLRLEAVDAQGAALGALPVQRLRVE